MTTCRNPSVTMLATKTDSKEGWNVVAVVVVVVVDVDIADAVAAVAVAAVAVDVDFDVAVAVVADFDVVLVDGLFGALVVYDDDILVVAVAVAVAAVAVVVLLVVDIVVVDYVVVAAVAVTVNRMTQQVFLMKRLHCLVGLSGFAIFQLPKRLKDAIYFDNIKIGIEKFWNEETCKA